MEAMNKVRWTKIHDPKSFESAGFASPPDNCGLCGETGFRYLYAGDSVKRYEPVAWLCSDCGALYKLHKPHELIKSAIHK
jgi:rubredoxin